MINKLKKILVYIVVCLAVVGIVFKGIRFIEYLLRVFTPYGGRISLSSVFVDISRVCSLALYMMLILVAKDKLVKGLSIAYISIGTVIDILMEILFIQLPKGSVVWSNSAEAIYLGANIAGILMIVIDIVIIIRTKGIIKKAAIMHFSTNLVYYMYSYGIGYVFPNVYDSDMFILVQTIYIIVVTTLAIAVYVYILKIIDDDCQENVSTVAKGIWEQIKKVLYRFKPLLDAITKYHKDTKMRGDK